MNGIFIIIIPLLNPSSNYLFRNYSDIVIIVLTLIYYITIYAMKLDGSHDPLPLMTFKDYNSENVFDDSKIHFKFAYTQVHNIFDINEINTFKLFQMAHDIYKKRNKQKLYKFSSTFAFFNPCESIASLISPDNTLVLEICFISN